MTISITIHKAQGENRVRGLSGALVATQPAKYVAALRNANGHPIFWTPTKRSVSNLKKHVEELFGPLAWSGTPDVEGMYGEAEVSNENAIAAAPDLLEACKGWVSLYESHKTGDCTPPGCAVCRCRAAIAKAEGIK